MENTQKPKKMDYWEARSARYDRVNYWMLDLANKLKEQGCKVFTLGRTGDKDRITWLGVELNGKHVSVCFSEVPYRWVYGVDIDKKLNRGSGITVKVSDDCNTPPTVSEVLEQMRPIVNGYSKANYMREI